MVCFNVDSLALPIRYLVPGYFKQDLTIQYEPRKLLAEPAPPPKHNVRASLLSNRSRASVCLSES